MEELLERWNLAEEKRFVKNLLPITGRKFLNNILAASQGTQLLERQFLENV